MILRENPGPPSYRTDVFSLAVVLYELLTGRHPFAPGERREPRPIREALSGFEYVELEDALRQALRFEPEKRIQTMAEFRETLDLARERVLAHREPVLVLHEADAPGPSPLTAAVSGGTSSTPEPASLGSTSSAPGGASGPVSELPRSSVMTTRGVRAKTASGSVLTAAGIGLLGGAAVVVGLEVQRAGEMQGLVSTALAEQRKFTSAEDRRFNELKAELLHGRDVAIGVGVAGLVSVGAGVALLVTPRRRGAPARMPSTRTVARRASARWCG